MVGMIDDILKRLHDEERFIFMFFVLMMGMAFGFYLGYFIQKVEFSISPEQCWTIIRRAAQLPPFNLT